MKPTITALGTKEMEGFAQFWAAYPRKIGKGAARKAWIKSARIRPPLAEVLAAVARYEPWRAQQAAATGWAPELCHPATWLNQERWDDELSVSAPAGQLAAQASEDAHAQQQRDKREREAADAARSKAAGMAFAELLAVVRAGGVMPLLGFADSRVARVLQVIGGWQWLRTATEDQLRARWPAFVKAFSALPPPIERERAQVVSIKQRRVA